MKKFTLSITLAITEKSDVGAIVQNALQAVELLEEQGYACNCSQLPVIGSQSALPVSNEENTLREEYRALNPAGKGFRLAKAQAAEVKAGNLSALDILRAMVSAMRKAKESGTAMPDNETREDDEHGKDDGEYI